MGKRGVPKGTPSPLRGTGKGIAFLRSLTGHAGDECITWPMFRDPLTGYGRTSTRFLPGAQPSIGYAHRLMCELAHGAPPSPSHEAAHSCGRGKHGCVNPNHLSWKTRSENQLDRRRHGTHVTSRWGARGKLTPQQREEIRALRGKMTQVKIAAIYDVHFETVSRIQRTTPRQSP